jgi:Rod binding domain-containing protein
MEEDGMTTEAQEQARQTAGTAAEEGKHVAGVAKDEARHVTQEATEHARSMLDQAMRQVEEQSRTQRDRLVGTLRTFSDDLDQMASQGGGSGIADELVRQAADRARRFGNHLDGREPQQLLDEVRDFARRRPGTFLFGALAAGVVAGRLTRGAKDTSNGGSAVETSPQTGAVVGSDDGPRGTAAGQPLAGTPLPTSPAYPDDTAAGLDQPVPGAAPTGETRPGGVR